MVYDKISCAKYSIKYKDYFHLKNLYLMIRNWLVEEGWIGSDADFGEVLYVQRDLPKMDRFVKFLWRFTKEPANTKAGFIEYHMDFNFLVVQLRDREVVHQGQKYSTNWGEITIAVNAYIVTDPKGKWKGHGFLKHVLNIFRSRFYKDLLLKHRQELYREAYRLQGAIKSYFDLRTHLPEPEDQAGLTFPKKGVGEA